MDENVKELMNQKLEITKRALIKNNMNAIILDNVAEVQQYLRDTLESHCSVSLGGSQTLFECGLIEQLRLMDINLEDRYDTSLTRDEQMAIFRKAFQSDYYISSSNAVTMNGELYNVDGTSNRVAALSFGPKKVILIVGQNKVVQNLEEARQRVESIAAPANCIRLNKDNACTHTGHCIDCQSETRICCTYVTHKRQIEKNRITVVLVKENLGY